jgi:hypothetical protein
LDKRRVGESECVVDLFVRFFTSMGGIFARRFRRDCIFRGFAGIIILGGFVGMVSLDCFVGFVVFVAFIVFVIFVAFIVFVEILKSS